MSDHERDRNPYAPPAAELIDPGESLSRRLGWKAYFWLILVLYPVAYLMSGVGWMQIVDLVDMMVSAIALVGLFGFAYRRRVAARRFWKLWLPAEVVWDLAVIFLLIPAGLAYQYPDETPSFSSAGEDFASVLFLIPLYIALFGYAYRSPELWREG